MENELVSIIITTYARPDNLTRAIDSVFAQSYKPIEVIVVDDNGDGTEYQLLTEKVLDSYIKDNRIIYIKHKFNRNGSAARNTGVNAAKGRYIGLLDDDDEFTRDKIEVQVDALIHGYSKDPLCQACYCNTELSYGHGKKGNRINHKVDNLANSLLLGESCFNTSTFLSTKESYIAINGFDERFSRHQDWEFFIRYLSRYHMILPSNPKPLIIKHITPNAITRNPERLIEYKDFFLQEMKVYIEKLPEPNLIYYRQYMDLALGLTQYGFFRKALFYWKRAKSYRKIRNEDKKQLFRRVLRFFRYKF